MSDVYLTILDVAKRLQVSDDKVRALMRTGKLAAIRIGHRTVRISEATLEAYMQSINRKAKP